MKNKSEFKKVVLFGEQKIRRVLIDGQWWFSVVDVVRVLTDSSRPDGYWVAMKTRVKNEGDFQLSTICRQLKFLANDGKYYLSDAANTESLFRVIQSIPSPKAEPFKRWLAKVGYERVQEISDPELAVKRTKELYKLKGYSDDWIEKRLQSIAIREKLTTEWKNRGAKNYLDYEILTAEISKATFGLTPTQYKKVKNIDKENLRDHMDDLELIFNMLGERATTEIHRVEDSYSLNKLKVDSQFGGEIAGEARKNLEKRLKKPIVNPKNFLANSENKKLS